MTIAYPTDLPCAARAGHGAAIYAGLVRSPMQAGNSRQRRSHRALPHMISLSFVMPQTIYAEWLQWINNHAFDEWVEMKLPGLRASIEGTDTAAILVRFCSDLRARLVPIFRLWYWEVSVDCEWMPTADDLALVPPPEPGTLLLGLHLDGDLYDRTPRFYAYDMPNWTSSGVVRGVFIPGAGAFAQQAWRVTPSANPIRSLDLPAGGGNLGSEWQLSAFLKPVYTSSYSYTGGQLLALNSRGSGSGATVAGGASAGVPPAAAGAQLSIRFGGAIGSSPPNVAPIQVTYPGFNAAGNVVEAITLKNPISGLIPSITADGGVHHFGIACDVDGVRMYWDGVLIADDSDVSIGPHRPAGVRPMWTGTSYVNQFFLIGAAHTGAFGTYGLAYPWGNSAPSFGQFWNGDMSELSVRVGTGSATFKGSTCEVPAERFIDPPGWEIPPPPPAGSGWATTDVAMSQAVFAFTNSNQTVDNIGTGTSIGRGTVRGARSIDASKGKRYVEIVVEAFGTNAALGLVVGFSKPASAMAPGWNVSTNKNATSGGGGTRNSYGQTNTDSSSTSLAAWNTAVAGTVIQMTMEIGVGWRVAHDNGSWVTNTGAPYTETDACLFACLGDGNFGASGDGFKLTLLTTALTQHFPAPSGYTAWDD